MALDTRNKRASAVGHFYTVLPLPDGVVSANDWKQVAWVYRGITATLTYIFQPPTVDDVPPIYVVPDREYPATGLSQMLWRHYRNRPRGRTVLKAADGTYTTVDHPSQDDLDAAERFYLGGHVHVVDADERAALVAAGYMVSEQ